MKQVYVSDAILYIYTEHIKLTVKCKYSILNIFWYEETSSFLRQFMKSRSSYLSRDVKKLVNLLVYT